MTGKRFRIIGDSNIEFIMQDKLLLPIYDGKKRLSLKECCDKLNELCEENQQLEMETEELNEDAMSYQTLYEQQLEKCEGLLSECKHQQEQKMKFYKENKELKQQLEDCEFAHRTEMAHHRVVEKELEEKIAKRDYTSRGLYDD